MTFASLIINDKFYMYVFETKLFVKYEMKSFKKNTTVFKYQNHSKLNNSAFTIFSKQLDLKNCRQIQYI